MNHFSEQIQILAPAEAPFKCPKCEYIAKARYSLYIHIGNLIKVYLISLLLILNFELASSNIPLIYLLAPENIL